MVTKLSILSICNKYDVNYICGAKLETFIVDRLEFIKDMLVCCGDNLSEVTLYQLKIIVCNWKEVETAVYNCNKLQQRW